jgi:acetyltransferase-like isoleucine patch superfamily enzyme
MSEVPQDDAGPAPFPEASKFFRTMWLATTWMPSWRASRLRVRLLRREGATVGDNVRFGPLCRVFGPAGLTLEDGVAFARNVFIDGRGGLVVGRESLIGFDTVLSTWGHRFDDAGAPVHAQGFAPEPITIGARVWIGARVFVVPGTTIGDEAIVGTMALVTRSVDAKTIVGGVPARVLRDR